MEALHRGAPGAELVKRYLPIWEDTEPGPAIRALIRDAFGSERASELLRDALLGDIGAAAGTTDPLGRELALTHLPGIAIGRHIGRLPAPNTPTSPPSPPGSDRPSITTSGEGLPSPGPGLAGRAQPRRHVAFALRFPDLPMAILTVGSGRCVVGLVSITGSSSSPRVVPRYAPCGLLGVGSGPSAGRFRGPELMTESVPYCRGTVASPTVGCRHIRGGAAGNGATEHGNAAGDLRAEIARAGPSIMMVSLVGAVDIAGVHLLAAATADAVSAVGAGGRIVLELNRVTFLGACGLGAILVAHDDASERGSAVVLVVDEVAPAARVVGLLPPGKRPDVYATVTTALTSTCTDGAPT